MPTDSRTPWFAAKRYGYGSGLPIAWQGWAVLIAYFAVCIGSARLLPVYAGPLVVVAATVLLVIVCKRRTKGGWRWRSGGGDV